MDDPVPDFAALWNELAKASPDEVLEALQKAGLLSPEQLGRLQALGTVSQPLEPSSAPPSIAPTADAPEREAVGAHLGP